MKSMQVENLRNDGTSAVTPQQEEFIGRKLHVAQMLTYYGTGGIARHVLDLSTWLEVRGHTVSPVSTGGEWGGSETNPRFVDLPLLGVTAYGGAMPRRLLNLVRSVVGMRRWLRQANVDVIHAHDSGPALVARLAVGARKIPILTTYHGSPPERVPGFARIAAHSDLVITPSRFAAEELIEKGGLARDQVRVIGLGVKPAPPKDSAEVARVRSELLGDGTHLVVSLSRLDHQKGIDILIEVVARLRDSNPHVRFAVVGDGPLAVDLPILARQRGVADRLQFIGRTEFPYNYLRAADLMVLTSRWEALPISIVESFRAGTPVVATRCSGVPDLVDDSVGACVPVEDVSAISEALIKLLDDPERRKSLSAAALQRSAEDRFQPDWINRNFEATYQKLAGRNER